MDTVYKVCIGGATIHATKDLGDAIRTYNRSAYKTGTVQGDGISRQSWNGDGCMVKDGWIVCHLNNHVYVNPNLVERES